MADPVASTIMCIRHAEKPVGEYGGVDQYGAHDPSSLIPQGWQRAGALASFFDPSDGQFSKPGIATPQFVFASNFTPPSDGSKPQTCKPDEGDHLTKRPQETVWPLVAKLGSRVTANYQYYIGQDENDVAVSALACDGVVLIAWEHNCIPTIVSNFPTKAGVTVPTSWPNRFDLVWVFQLESGQYTFQEVYQGLLAGDQ